jgi:hypothetical protein
MKDFVIATILTMILITHVIVYKPPVFIPVLASVLAMSYFTVLQNQLKTPQGCAFLVFETLTVQFLIYALLIFFHTLAFNNILTY